MADHAFLMGFDQDEWNFNLLSNDICSVDLVCQEAAVHFHSTKTNNTLTEMSPQNRRCHQSESLLIEWKVLKRDKQIFQMNTSE